MLAFWWISEGGAQKLRSRPASSSAVALPLFGLFAHALQILNQSSI
jgi:hypothetical protein